MTYKGDFVAGATVRIMWNSNAVAGQSITRATNGTISVYKDGGTTQSVTGVTDTEDFDGLTGVHLVAIDTSSDATFYSEGSDFNIVLSAATIDGVTINANLASFSIRNRTHLLDLAQLVADDTTDSTKLSHLLSLIRGYADNTRVIAGGVEHIKARDGTTNLGRTQTYHTTVPADADRTAS